MMSVGSGIFLCSECDGVVSGSWSFSQSRTDILKLHDSEKVILTCLGACHLFIDILFRVCGHRQPRD